MNTFEFEIVGTVRSKERFVAPNLLEACQMARQWARDHLQDDGELTYVRYTPTEEPAVN